MLGSNTGERLRLHLLFTILAVFLLFEDTIVAMIVLDFGASNVIQPLFKTLFVHDGLTGAERYLILTPNEPRCSVIVDSSTIKTTA
jgi:hypothetical protein